MTKPTPAEASAGHNKLPALTSDELVRDFAYLDTALAEIEKLVKQCPPVAEDDEDIDKIRTAVRRCVGAYKRLESVRVEAKERFLSACRITDSHFNDRKDRVEEWQTNLEAIAKRLLDKRDAAERARLEEEAHRAREAALAAAETARLAEQERIRKEQEQIDQEQEHLAETLVSPSLAAPEPEAAPVTQADIEAARRVEHVASAEALAKSNHALKAQEATRAKPADLVRVRSSDGVSTLQRVFKFEIEDLSAIDLNELREHISLADIEKAISRFVSLNKR